MNRLIIFLAISILNLGITSCKKSAINAAEQLTHIKHIDNIPTRLPPKYFPKTYFEEEVYESAYKAALDYQDSQKQKVSLYAIKEVANKEAYKKNKELGYKLKDASVTVVAGAAGAAAYKLYTSPSEVVYQNAYRAALNYLKSAKQEVSLDTIAEVANKEAYKKNQELGYELTDASVGIAASAAASKAYTEQK